MRAKHDPHLVGGCADLEDETIWMIVGARYNYDLLALSRTANMLEFERWFYENVVG